MHHTMRVRMPSGFGKRDRTNLLLQTQLPNLTPCSPQTGVKGVASHPPNVFPGPQNGQCCHPCSHGRTSWSPFVPCPHANSVGRAWTAWAPMASIVVKACALNETSSKGLWLQQRLLLMHREPVGIHRADGK